MVVCGLFNVFFFTDLRCYWDKGKLRELMVFWEQIFVVINECEFGNGAYGNCLLN